MSNSNAAVSGQWVALEAHSPGQVPARMGILLHDNNDLFVRIRSDWEASDECEAEIWRELGQDLRQSAECIGAPETLRWLVATASHSIQVTEPQSISFRDRDPESTLNALYSRHILSSENSGILPQNRLAILQPRTSGPQEMRGPKTLSKIAHQRWVAIAAGALVMLSGRIGKTPSTPAVSPLREVTARQVLPQLPLDTASLHLVSLDLSSLTIRAPRKQSKKKHAAVTPARKAFHISPSLMIVEPQHVQVALAEPPHLTVAVESQPIEPLSSALPELPKFKRRNPIVTVMAALATPFKLLAR